ncbi:MAG: MBL fold metallo-hydrolase [Coriobacteriia bacterium]|nr:MBL fold metallo-hydrolase [Coriobacteriia bacterium]
MPSFYCGCKACDEALVEPRAARACSGILISGEQRTLIDAPPELRTQLIREQVDGIDQALFTHEHFDHLGGLPQLEFYVRIRTRSPLPVYSGARTLATINQQYGFMVDTLELHPLKAFETVCFDGVSYTALPAAHCEDSFGFLIESGQVASSQSARPSRTAYFPDTGPLAAATMERLQDLDTLIIDATFSGVNWMPSKHHSIDEAIALARQLGPRQTYLTHLAMHFDTPITLEELERKLAECEENVKVAHDGLSIIL